MCPFCTKQGQFPCSHFVGWTEDGRSIPAATVYGKGEKTFHYAPQLIRDTDVVVKTGVSARVFRPQAIETPGS